MEGTPGTPGADSESGAVAEAASVDTGASEGAIEATGVDTGAAAAVDGGTDGVAEGSETVDAEAAADAADLEQYPEAVRESFKSLKPAERKSLYEQAEARIEEKIRTERERNDKLEADNKAREAKRQEIRAKAGRFVGAEAQTVKAPDGSDKLLPAYDELVKLSTTRAGRDTLYEKYGLDEDATERQRAEWDERHEMIQSVATELDDQAWGKLDVSLRAGIKSKGLDPDAILASAQSPGDIVSQLVDHLEGKHAAEKKKLTDDYEGRIGLHTKNAEAMRGQVVGATSRQLATGGRTSGGAGELTLESFRALPPDQRQKMRREQSDVVDRLYAQDARR